MPGPLARVRSRVSRWRGDNLTVTRRQPRGANSQHSGCLNGNRTIVYLMMVLAVLGSPVSIGAQTATPPTNDYRRVDDGDPYAGEYEDLERAMNAFWSDAFSAMEVAYQRPVIAQRILDTACGERGVVSNAFYCAIDQSIYIDPRFVAEQEALIGDYAPILVLAHEWGHHIQNLLHVPDNGGNAFELQADCLAGVYTRYAEDQGLLEQGDFVEALQISEAAGDPVWFPQDAPEAHGTYADRRNAVMRGYLDGVVGCELNQLTATDENSEREDERIKGDTVENTGTGGYPDLWFPESPAVAHAACFRVDIDDPSWTLEELTARFTDGNAARQRLLDWGWQESGGRAFGCDKPPEDEAGWIDVHLHRFGSATSAQQAVDYFAATSAEGTWLRAVTPPAIGDHAVALTGPASNGKEFTVYASQGPLLIRVTGVSPTGIPFDNVLTVARSVLTANQGGSRPVPVPDTPPSSAQPATAYLPAVPAVNHGDCFQILDHGTYSYNDVVDALGRAGASRTQVDSLGWIDGAYVVFTCADPPFGRANQIDVVVHQFQEADQARRYFDRMYDLGTNASRACDHAQVLVACVSARSESGSPLSDVHFVLSQVMSAAR